MKVWVTGAYQEPETLLIPGTDGVYQEPEAARIKSGDAWVDVWPTKFYLIKNGIPQAEYTVNDYMNSSSASDSWHKGKAPGTGRSNGSFDISQSRQDYSHHGIGSLFFKPAIDLSRYKKIVVRMAAPITDKTSGSEAWMMIAVTDAIKNGYVPLANLSLPSAGRNGGSIEIGSLSGSRYVVITMCAASTTSDTYVFKIADIWLEK